MNITQVITSALVLAAIGAGAYLMNMVFGLVGVVLFLLFTAPVIGFVMWLSNRQEGSTTRSSNVQSKGARSRED